MVCQWAAQIKTDKTFKEITDLKVKYPWLRCPETLAFIRQMSEDLPKILNIIKLQEKQNAMLRFENEKLHGYINANRMADEFLLDEIKAKYPLIEI